MPTSLPLDYISEPRLLFKHSQKIEHPQDGLFLYGPLDEKHPNVIRAGVIGTSEGIRKYSDWVAKIQSLVCPDNNASSIPFPGFEAAFGAKWDPEPYSCIEINEGALLKTIHSKNRSEGVYNAVNVYLEAIQKFIVEEDNIPDFWFVVIPEQIYTFGRPKSIIPKPEQLPSKITITKKQSDELIKWPSLFDEYNLEAEEAAEVYRYQKDFRAQLKARLLNDKQIIQIVRETTIAPTESRKLQDEATVAWNLCTTAFYKAGGRPWKIADVREGVCYIGLVFKKSSTDPENNNACCGAQMFLNSGEGLVFKGALGPWYSTTNKEFHLDKESASKLIQTVLEAYSKNHNNQKPKELFIHGKTRFREGEWQGFVLAVPEGTKIAGVRIIKASGARLKLFTNHKYPVLRGMALKVNDRRGFLWASGFIPRLQNIPRSRNAKPTRNRNK